MLSLTGVKKNLSRTDRDCFPASLSCIVDVPYETMPKLRSLPVHKIIHPKPRSRWGVWYRKHGIRVRWVHNPPRDRLYIGIYQCKFAKPLHAVVCYNDRIVHDTSPIKSVLYPKAQYYLLVEEYDY